MVLEAVYRCLWVSKCAYRNRGYGDTVVLTGLAAAVAFRAKFWNIGAEGQLYAGALAVTFFGTEPD